MYQIWIKRIVGLFLIGQLLRLMFFALNVSTLGAISGSEIITGFLVGLRFDAAIIATLNGPLIILHYFRKFLHDLRWRKGFDDFVSVLFIFKEIPLIVVGIGDANLFPFTGRRANLELLDLSKDLGNQSIGLLWQYWYLTLLGIALVFFFALFTWQQDHSPSHRRALRIHLPFKLPRYISDNILKKIIFLIIFIICARGGLQKKPLAPAHAFAWQPSVLSNLILNPGMNLLRSPPREQISHHKDFNSYEELLSYISPPWILNPENANAISKPQLQRNFVIIIVESLGSEYVGFLNNGKGYTPFLDTLASNALTFKESFSSGRRSIDAMPAIFSGIPAWRDQPFITSSYNGNQIASLPKSLRSVGYGSYFFHGAENGSMHFDVFSKMIDFDRYIGMDQYDKDGDFDGQWGIFDEPFLNFTSRELSKAHEPFLAGIFTLSSHNPFTIPKQYVGKFPKGTLPIHESIGYADYSLSKFFENSRKEPWFNNTIFIITGDHSSLSDQEFYNNVLGRSRVPIIIFDPLENSNFIGQKDIAQHVDIPSTVGDLAFLNPDKFSKFGRSVFSPRDRSFSILWEYGKWYWKDSESILEMEEDGTAYHYQGNDIHFTKRLPLDSQTMEKLARLKAYRQYYTNGLLDNRWL
ncbi:MAG: sulfatase-like hydrolase/transferase [Proteobacteria bacterium]|nr:sulfatase-like hydrolase/transferase [Pseudomonadota bacterium]